MTGHDKQEPETGGTLGRLEVLLDEQHDLYLRLETLSKSQGELIEADRTDELLTLLAERGGIVEVLERSNAAMHELRAELETEATLTDADRERLRERVAGVRALAERVAAQDAEDERALEARRDAIAGEIDGNTRGRSAVSAYWRSSGAYSSGNGPRFQDRRA